MFANDVCVVFEKLEFKHGASCGKIFASKRPIDFIEGIER